MKQELKFNRMLFFTQVTRYLKSIMATPGRGFLKEREEEYGKNAYYEDIFNKRITI